MSLFKAVLGGSLPTLYHVRPTRKLLRRLLDEMLNDDLPVELPTRDHWEAVAKEPWVAKETSNIAPWVSPDCFLTVLEGWLLDRVRGDRSLSGPEARRAARLWCSFARRGRGAALTSATRTTAGTLSRARKGRR